MAHLFDLLLTGPFLLAGLVLFALTRDPRRCPALAGTVLPEAPLQLGPYTLGSKLGEGAMGEVYRAWSSAAGAWHAVKLLPREASATERRRFEKEARLGALVQHPNAVSILKPAEERQGMCYYAMELVEGTNLQELVEREGPQPAARVARILEQLAAALAVLHEHGLVHRDIKPENVLLAGGERELCKLTDFGLVEHVGALAEGQPEGALIGTPLYISPEAIAAPETVGPASDLYGLGAVGYFLLRGAPVFQGGSLIEVCCHHLHTPPEPLPIAADDPVAAEVARVVLECLAKSPGERPASAAAVARRLARCREAPCLPSRRAARARLGAAADGGGPARVAECRIAA